MATVRKRIGKKGVSWQIDYFEPDGTRVRKSFKKRKEAEAELGKRVSLIAEGRYLDVKKEYKTTLDQVITKYEENYRHQSSFNNAKRKYLENYREYFGKKTLLVNIRYMDLETYSNHLRQKLTPRKTVRKDSSINREMGCLHHIFRKAVEWEMVDQSPFKRGKAFYLKENNQRLRFLNQDEIDKLIENCPPHLRRVVICVLNTGMRRGEVLSLKWSQVRNGFIYLQETKTNESRQIPVNEDLKRLFKEIRREQNPRGVNVVGLDGKPVKRTKTSNIFLYDGKPFHLIKESFKTALKNAGITDFRFHDLRHTFASQLIMGGGSLKDVQELLGHKTMTMTLRYAHLSQEHKRKAVNLLNGLTNKARREILSQNCHKLEKSGLGRENDGLATG